MNDKVSNERLAVTRDDAITFLEGACRNWSSVPTLSEDDIGDVATELLRFVAKRSAGSFRNAQSEAVAQRLATGIREIMRACVDGRVCDDVAWFDDIETLFDKCASILGDLLPEAEYEALRDAHPTPQSEAVAVKALDIADDNDGIEQDAFEAWAKAERYDMHEHPMHWLFLDAKTAAARDGWRAGIRHSRARIRSALTHPAPPLAVTDERDWSSQEERTAARAGELAAFEYSNTGGGPIGVFLAGLRAYRVALTAALEAKQ